MAGVIVIAPVDAAGLPEGAVRYGTAREAIDALEADGDGVLVSDGLAINDLERVATAVRARSGQTIEVRYDRWDGATPSPLSAACRGVISGFGAAGVQRALGALTGG